MHTTRLDGQVIAGRGVLGSALLPSSSGCAEILASGAPDRRFEHRHHSADSQVE